MIGRKFFTWVLLIMWTVFLFTDTTFFQRLVDVIFICLDLYVLHKAYKNERA